MTRRPPLHLAMMALLIAMLACNVPGVGGPAPDMTATFAAALTQAFATVQANLPGATGTPIAAVSPTSPPATAAPSDTPPPASSPTPTGCTDSAQFVADVTIPDGTQFATPSTFTKTWRVRNSGTCTWSSTYTLRFLSGAQLGGPTAVAFPGAVAPGDTMDVSVILTSPAAAGTYTGRWRLTNASGTGFATLIVTIGVPATATPVPPTATPVTPTPTAPLLLIIPLPTTVTLAAGGGTGGIFSPPGTVYGAPNAGDDENNASRQGFVTFSLAGIPAGATITAVKLDLNPFDQLGNPFSLGCLRVYQQNYGALDPSDFFTGSALGALWRFCSAVSLSDAATQTIDPSGIALVQSSLASGQFQIRLQFNEMATNSNNTADLLRPTPHLVVTYTGP